MSAETVLFDGLSNNAGVSGLVSNRIYPQVLPHGVVLPAIVYGVVSGRAIRSNGGRSVRIQMDLYAATYGELKALRDAVLAYGDDAGFLHEEGGDGYEEKELIHRQSIDIFITNL